MTGIGGRYFPNLFPTLLNFFTLQLQTAARSPKVRCSISVWCAASLSEGVDRSRSGLSNGTTDQRVTRATDAYFLGRRSLQSPTKILGARRMEHTDLPHLERLIRPETYDIFGDFNLGRVYEASCLSMVQCNENYEIVSGICLCNYPNVPAVAPDDWLTWLYTLYRAQDVTERNAMFVHVLVWDKRYTGCFFKDLLTGLFDVTSYMQHVLLVIPPRIILMDVFEQQMTKIPLRCTPDRHSVQSVYMTDRYLKNPRLKIRRVVEEDNDNVIPIVDAESTLVKESYGEFYVSEMVRNPDNCRRLIVSEDDDGLATGVMFLNSNVDVDMLNENFELLPYNGLRKSRENDRFPPETMQPASETFFSVFSRKPRQETPRGSSEKLSPEQSMEDFKDTTDSDDSVFSMNRRSSAEKLERSKEKAVDPSLLTLLSDVPSLADYVDVYYQTKMKSSVFADSLFTVPRKSMVMSVQIDEVLSSEQIQVPSQPVYYGEVDAFVLEIFAMQEQVKRRWCRNFLEAAFECFPDSQYCAILLPFSHPFLPLLEHFVRVPLKCNKDFPMTLYVTHRTAILGEMKLREARLSDREQVQDLLQRIPKSEEILADFDTAVKKKQPDLRCYVLHWGDVVVGVAILCVEKEATYVRRRFHVEDYVAAKDIPNDAYGRILHFLLMPVFCIHMHHFICEIVRFSGMTVLYYRLTESTLSALTRTHPVAMCLNTLIPLRPRQRIEYRYSDVLVETDEPETQTEFYSLFVTTPRLAMIPKMIVDSKVVVVGASDCGVAFLEQLAFGHSFVRFANLTLISPNGLPFEDENNDASARMIPFRGRYCRKYRRVVATRAWINVVYGTVIAIQRKKKYVTVMQQGNIAYDYLILTCGMQYQRPRFQEEMEEQKRGEFLDYETPWNCLTINDDTDAVACLETILKLTSNLQREKKIIFYGHNIDCYCALQGLLEFGIKGSWITLVQPPLQPCTTHDDAFFNNCEVYVEVMKSISRNKIEVLVGWELIDWNLEDSRNGKTIESIVLRLKGKIRTVGCDALLCFHEKTINMRIFLAICRAGLMFDGHLVINAELRTNDSCIFAAGTITKYCRIFYLDAWQHVHFSSVEIGERLAKGLQSIIEKEHRSGTVSESFKHKTYRSLTVFRSPKILACTLPGGYRFFHICKPGKPMPRKIAIRYGIYGQVLTTGSCTSEIGYFRIRLNRFNTIETVTCFNKKDFEMHHMISLVGKHESLLNELKTRFKNSLIADFYAYFREPWAMAIFHDRFECLRVENRALLLSKTAIPGQSLVNDCIRALVQSKWNPIREDDRHTIQSRFAGSVYQQEIEENLLEFLQFCEEDIPVYCTPEKLREFYANIEDSPLYNDL